MSVEETTPKKNAPTWRCMALIMSRQMRFRNSCTEF